MSRTTIITSEPVARFSGPPADRMAGRSAARAARAQGHYAPGGAGSKAAAELRATAFLRREELLDIAMHQGVIGGALRAHYAACFDADPEGTRAHLESLGLAKTTAGVQQTTAASADAYDTSLLTDAERRRVAAAGEGRQSTQVISGGL